MNINTVTILLYIIILSFKQIRKFKKKKKWAKKPFFASLHPTQEQNTKIMTIPQKQETTLKKKKNIIRLVGH